MKFRNHLDPLYYDSAANKLVFVPTINVRHSLTMFIGGRSNCGTKIDSSQFPRA